MHPCGVEQIRKSISVKEGTYLCRAAKIGVLREALRSVSRARSFLWRGAALCCKIPTFVGISKYFQNMAVFSLRLKVSPPLTKELILHLVALVVQNRQPV